MFCHLNILISVSLYLVPFCKLILSLWNWFICNFSQDWHWKWAETDPKDCLWKWRLWCRYLSPLGQRRRRSQGIGWGCWESCTTTEWFQVSLWFKGKFRFGNWWELTFKVQPNLFIDDNDNDDDDWSIFTDNFSSLDVFCFDVVLSHHFSLQQPSCKFSRVLRWPKDSGNAKEECVGVRKSPTKLNIKTNSSSSFSIMFTFGKGMNFLIPPAMG